MAVHQTHPQGGKVAALDPIWDHVRSEAEEIVRREPELATFIYSVVMQHGRIDECGELRLTANDLFRLAAHVIPDRIKRCDFAALRMGLMHGHGFLTGSIGNNYNMAGRLRVLQTGNEKVSIPRARRP